MKITCPLCKKQSSLENNPFRPFCSERCRLTDLGQWAQEKYAIASKEIPSEFDLLEEESSELNDEEDDEAITKDGHTGERRKDPEDLD